MKERFTLPALLTLPTLCKGIEQECNNLKKIWQQFFYIC